MTSKPPSPLLLDGAARTRDEDAEPSSAKAQHQPLTGGDIWQWRNAICASPDLLSGAKVVGLRLSFHMRANSGVAWPSQATLAAETAMSQPSVHRHLASLIESGWLALAQIRRRGQASKYMLTAPEAIHLGESLPTQSPPQSDSPERIKAIHTGESKQSIQVNPNSQERFKNRSTIKDTSAVAAASARAPATTPAWLVEPKRGGLVLGYTVNDLNGVKNKHALREFEFSIGPWWARHSLVAVGAFDHLLPELAESYESLGQWLEGLNEYGSVIGGVHLHPSRPDWDDVDNPADHDEHCFEWFKASPFEFIDDKGYLPTINLRVDERGRGDFEQHLNGHLEYKRHVDLGAIAWRKRPDKHIVYVERDGVLTPRVQAPPVLAGASQQPNPLRAKDTPA
ncbi:helix-turn-helix domain-containing protein [Jatrophihabitans sp. DSM 45814]